MKRSLAIFSMWAATIMVLLSTVVMHHHHYEQICVALEIGTHGAADDIEAEPETTHSHQESDRGSCRVHQLHTFIVSHGVAKTMCRAAVMGGAARSAQLPDVALLPVGSGRIATAWQHTATLLPEAWLRAMSRRGPPVFQFSCALRGPVRLPVKGGVQVG